MVAAFYAEFKCTDIYRRGKRRKVKVSQVGDYCHCRNINTIIALIQINLL